MKSATSPASLVPLAFRKHKSSKSSSKSKTKSKLSNTNGSPLSVSLGTFSPPFDVVNELSVNRDDYVGNDPFTISYVPSFLRTCIDRVRARVVSVSKPGLAITCACCITYGIRLISHHPDIKELLRLKEQLDLIDSSNINMDDLEELAAWFRSFPITVPSHSAYTARKHNIYLPEHLKLELFDLGSELGTGGTSLATLAIMVTMADQTRVILAEHAELLNYSIDAFLRRVQIRVKVGTALLESLSP